MNSSDNIDQMRLFEAENDATTENLFGKINKIKHITIEMQQDLDHQNSGLDGMNSNMDSVSDGIARTAQKLRMVLQQPYYRRIAQIAGGIVGLLVVWLLFRK